MSIWAKDLYLSPILLNLGTMLKAKSLSSSLLVEIFVSPFSAWLLDLADSNLEIPFYGDFIVITNSLFRSFSEIGLFTELHGLFNFMFPLIPEGTDG